MLMTEAEDLQQVIANVERDTGRDMTAMRAIADEVMAMEVGDPTPTPGSLLVEPPAIVLPAPLHEGLMEPPEGGKFYLPPFTAATSMPRQVRRLSRRITKLTYWLLGLTMCFISLLVVLVKSW